MFGRRVKFICPGCGHESKVSAAFVREHEAALCHGPGGPPEIECHWCHQGLMIPLKYRFRSGEVFRLPRDVLRALRGRDKTPQL